jgi:hypothetical protein
VAAVVFVMLFEIYRIRWVALARISFLQAVFALTIISALHYLYLVAQRLHALDASPET